MAEAAEDLATTSELQNPTDAIAQLLTAESDGEPSEAPSKDSVKAEDTEEDNEAEEATTDEDDGEQEAEEESEESTDEDDEDITWAKVLGIPENRIVTDDEGNLAGVNVKVDGKLATVGVNDLIQSYQTNKSNTQKSQALAEERKEFEGIRDTAAKTYEKRLQEVNKLTEYLLGKVQSEFETIDWNRLRVENPGEYAAQLQDFNQRQAELQQVMTAAKEDQDAHGGELSKEDQAKREAYLREQAERLQEANPHWVDPKVASQEYTGIGDFVTNQYGFSEEEFGSVMDARVIQMAQDAMKFRQGKQVVAKKLKSKEVPKFQKSSGHSPKGKKMTKLQKLTMAAKKAAPGPAKRDMQTNAIAEMLLQGDN
jgi:hypothetical protein